jgi:hypothetical protein
MSLILTSWFVQILATTLFFSDVTHFPSQVKISDVYPTGEAILIQDSALRMRWREGGLTPVYMESGVVYEVTVLVHLPSFHSSNSLLLLLGIFGTPPGLFLLVMLFVFQFNLQIILASL